MRVLHKALTLWLLMAVVKWSNGAFYNRAAALSVLDTDTSSGAPHQTFANHTDNVIDKFTTKRSTDAATAGFTTTHRIDDANRYTYLNIGVLMASHLGKFYDTRKIACTPTPTYTYTLLICCIAVRDKHIAIYVYAYDECFLPNWLKTVELRIEWIQLRTTAFHIPNTCISH